MINELVEKGKFLEATQALRVLGGEEGEFTPPTVDADTADGQLTPRRLRWRPAVAWLRQLIPTAGEDLAVAIAIAPPVMTPVPTAVRRCWPGWRRDARSRAIQAACWR